MKRLLIILALIISPLAMAAQNHMDDFFERHSGRQGYQTVIYGKKMLEMMKDGASSDVKALLDRIRIIRIVSCSSTDDSIISVARRDVKGCRRYEVISQINENGRLSEFYISEEGNSKEVSFVMIASSSQGSAVMEIIGRFDIKDISRLSVIGQKK